ncbi:MAG: tyrosine-type recombinase/integrase [Pyrinomonadaceae bacterium]|nr:tyrosine-type recombinase/integrase [Pyrinomonadaceae bacterium]
MRTPSRKAKPRNKLTALISATTRLWRKHHLTYDQARYVSKEVRKALSIERVKTRQRVVERLSREEEQRLIQHAYRDRSEHGLLIKTLFQTGARVSELANIRVEHFFFDELMILIDKGKGGKSRYVPVLPELAQELRTHLDQRSIGHLFETNRHLPYSPRRIQQIVKAAAEKAKIKKRVYPHLLRHSVATTLLERGMPIEQIQKFLGHSKLETTQVYAASTTEMIKESYRRALAEG